MPRPATFWPERRTALAAVLAAPLLAAAQALPRIETQDPRAYGWQIGDMVERRVSIFVPDGWRLDEATLPRAGARAWAIELRSVQRHDRGVAGGRSVELDLRYQVVLSPPAPRVLEIAPLRVKLEGAGRSEELRIEAAPVTVAPLVPEEGLARQGLGELQPERAPPPVETARWRWRLALWAALAAAAALWLAFILIGPVWRRARARPFGQAWRELRALTPDASGAEWRSACHRLHQALDGSAGETVFEPGLDRWLARAPRFESLRAELQRFLSLSRRAFFGDGGHEPGDAAWLRALARRLRDAERGSA